MSRVTAYLALGGNVGDVAQGFVAAVKALGALQGTRLVKASSLYLTPPWGLTEQADFLNACIALKTTLPAETLLQECLALEKSAGRDRAHALRWGPRPLDLDILVYGDVQLATSTLTLPHPRLLERAFVLLPLAEIAPDLKIAGQSIGDAARACDVSGIKKREGAWL